MSPFEGVRPPKGDDPMPGPSLFLRFGLAAVLALAGSCHYGVADIASVPDYPTYAKDVRPLLYDHCLLCHGSSPIRGAPSYFRLDVYDDTDGVFGILDGSEVVDVANPSSQSFQVRNRTLSNFKFHRAYRVDHLLYREVVGAITNSVYLRPWVSHVFWTKGTTSIGGRLDLVYARALDEGGTPGSDLDLGVEADLTAFLQLGTSFDARLVFAALFPLGGLDNAALGLDAEPAITLQGNFFWTF